MVQFGILYGRNVEPNLIGLCHSDWGVSVDELKNTFGYTFTLGIGVFSWASKKQKSFLQSTTEAEYVSTSIATFQAVWLRRIMEDIGEKQKNWKLPFFVTTNLQLL